LVEQRIENPRVVGSIPTPATIFQELRARHLSTVSPFLTWLVAQ
jgi:hypothetical protein